MLPAPIRQLSFPRALPCTGALSLFLPSERACKAASTAPQAWGTGLNSSSALPAGKALVGFWVRASLSPLPSLHTQSAVHFPEGQPQACTLAQRTEEPREGALALPPHRNNPSPFWWPGQACVVPVPGDFGVPCKHSGWPSLPPGWVAGQVATSKDQEGGFPASSGGMWWAWQGADSASARGTRSALL